MRRASLLLIPVALLASACGSEPEPAPAAPTPPTAEAFVQQVWDGWTEADRAATCKDYADNPQRTVDNTFPISSGIPTEHVAALLQRECKG
jgi:ABC-type sugar transport system substrate-binding protein